MAMHQMKCPNVFAWTIVLAGLGALPIGTPAFAASNLSVEGWSIHQVSANVCVASGPLDGEAELSVSAEGPMFELIVTAPDFPKRKAAYTASLAFDGKSAVSAPVLGDGGIMGINMGRGDSARTVVTASHVSITVEGHTHSFSLQNAGAALDSVAHCAGQPTLSEQIDEAPAPIAGGGNWKLATTLPGVSARVCSARIAGEQIDTNMLLNNVGDLVLVGGHQDWATWGGNVPLQLAIDGGPPVTMTAQTINNLIMVLVTEPELLQRLRNATYLDWTIPTGQVRGDVSGLGAALDAMKDCKAGNISPH